MAINLGSDNITDIYLDGELVTAIYIGEEQVI